MNKATLLAPLETFKVSVEPLLRRVLERASQEPQFYRDLDSALFQLELFPAEEIDCLNPWFFVVAMNGGGSAYGLYLHPEAAKNGVAPWVFWDHEIDLVFFLEENTDRFFRGFLSDLRSWLLDDAALIARIEESLRACGVQTDDEQVELGEPMEGENFIHRPNVSWLPPAKEDLKELSYYLALVTTNLLEAEKGLLAYAQYHQSKEALSALSQINNARKIEPARRTSSMPRHEWQPLGLDNESDDAKRAIAEANDWSDVWNDDES